MVAMRNADLRVRLSSHVSTRFGRRGGSVPDGGSDGSSVPVRATLPGRWNGDEPETPLTGRGERTEDDAPGGRMPKEGRLTNRSMIHSPGGSPPSTAASFSTFTCAGPVEACGGSRRCARALGRGAVVDGGDCLA